MNERYKNPIGRGRGVQTTDGCSVEVYKLTPYRGELEDIASYLQGRDVLELGCGTGRFTSRLLEMDCNVTAVDESEDMLSVVPAGVRAIRSSIETLHLEADFDIALLASFLFNNPARQVRRSLIDSVRRHLKSNGTFLLQVHSARLLTAVDERLVTTTDGISSHISDHIRAANVASMTVHYVINDEEWTHSFQAQYLTLDEVADELMQAGFSRIEWADQAQGWIVAN